jgi:flavin-binding protein dodecin
MADHVFKIIELVGTSKVSMEEAVNNAIARASKTVRDMQWFKVAQTRGAIENGKVAEWQVILKVGFKIAD